MRRGHWHFADNFVPHPYRRSTDAFPIESGEHLARLLHRYAGMEPRVVIVTTENGGKIFIGLGGALAAVEYYPEPGSRRALNAKPKRLVEHEEPWFVSEGEPSQFKYLMPVEFMIEIVSAFFREGAPPSMVDWV